MAMEDHFTMWEQMSIDQYAELGKATGAAVVKLNNTWWTRVRPFFYRPLLPFEIHDIKQVKMSFGKFSAFQHALANGQPHNSFLNLVIFDQVQSYNIMDLPKDKRKKIRRALKNNLTVSRITDQEAFIEKAFPVYTSFYNRTQYIYKKDRTNREKFTQWVRTLFRYSGVVIIGVFEEEKLVSFEVSCMVENVLIFRSAINSEIALKLHAPDLSLHFWRENAAKRPDIKMIYTSFFGVKRGINSFKTERGARVVALPAYLRINPLLLWLVKKLRKNVHERLIGMNERQVREKTTSIR